MSRPPRIRRRDVLRGGALVTAGSLVAPKAILSACDPTPGAGPDDPALFEWSGPFWREGAPVRDNLRGDRHDGRVLVISGTVLRSDRCEPIDGAVLDIWHCSPDGEYFTNPHQEEAGLFRGRVPCDDDGRYEYETLQPANYLVGGAMRPAHIHVTVHAPDLPDFVTQMYFEGDPYLDSDPLDLVRESLVCRPELHAAGELFRGRRSAGPFGSIEFDIAMPGTGA